MTIAKQFVQNAGVLRLPNLPGGFLQVADDGTVPGRFRQQVDTEANLSGLVLKNGELAYASDTQSLFIGDGATAGGLFLSQQWQTSGVLHTDGGVMTLDALSPTSNVFDLLLAANKAYEFLITAGFDADSSNTSNFALIVQADPAFTPVDLSFPYMCSMFWSPNAVDFLIPAQLEAQHEGRLIVSVDMLSMDLRLKDNLTRSEAQVSGTFRVKTIDPFTLSVIPVARASSPSAASCDLVVQYRRIG